jgi:hypothetical protein
MGNISQLSTPISPGEQKDLDDAPFSVTYVLPAKDFGAGNWTEVIESPARYRGIVKAITLYDVTEVFSTDTTEASVNVGTAGDADAFASSADLGALAADGSDCPALTDGVTKLIAPSTAIQVQGIAPTGGVPTGIATVAVTVLYFL